MKDKYLIKDSLEQMTHLKDSIDYILANGTHKSILTFQDIYDRLEVIEKELENYV